MKMRRSVFRAQIPAMVQQSHVFFFHCQQQQLTSWLCLGHPPERMADHGGGRSTQLCRCFSLAHPGIGESLHRKDGIQLTSSICFLSFPEAKKVKKPRLEDLRSDAHKPITGIWGSRLAWPRA